MENYEQMEFDVRLESDRNLQTDPARETEND